MPAGAEYSARMKRAGLLLGWMMAVLAAATALAQQPPGPPAVGVVPAARQSITQSTEYIGRIQATNRVNIVPRVAAFLEQVTFDEGAEVKKGDLLYRLEQAPFRADVQAKEASVAQFKAQLQNAQHVLARAQALLRTAAGQQSAVDIALANEQALQAQSRINLGYTEIVSPIDGKIGRTAVTAGNYVSAASGTLVTIVSQDPMYVLFQVSTRTVMDLQQKASQKSAAVIRLRLPDGNLYEAPGKLDFVDNTVTGNTDTITLRGVVPNLRHAPARRRPAHHRDPRGCPADADSRRAARRRADRPARRLRFRRQGRQGRAAPRQAWPVDPSLRFDRRGAGRGRERDRRRHPARAAGRGGAGRAGTGPTDGDDAMISPP